jgi:hypothetical protein
MDQIISNFLSKLEFGEVHPVRNGIGTPAADQQSIISNGVKKDDLNSKIEHYKPQAKVYSDAIRTIFGRSPKEVILFFLHLMEPVLVQ